MELQLSEGTITITARASNWEQLQAEIAREAAAAISLYERNARDYAELAERVCGYTALREAQHHQHHISGQHAKGEINAYECASCVDCAFASETAETTGQAGLAVASGE